MLRWPRTMRSSFAWHTQFESAVGTARVAMSKMQCAGLEDPTRDSTPVQGASEALNMTVVLAPLGRRDETYVIITAHLQTRGIHVKASLRALVVRLYHYPQLRLTSVVVPAAACYANTTIAAVTGAALVGIMPKRLATHVPHSLQARSLLDALQCRSLIGNCKRFMPPSVTYSASPATGRLVRVADAEQLESALRRDATYVIITAHLQTPRHPCESVAASACGASVPLPSTAPDQRCRTSCCMLCQHDHRSSDGCGAYRYHAKTQSVLHTTAHAG